MQRFRFGDLSFIGPDCWADVTLDQFLMLTEPDAPTSPAFIITTLTGLPESYFRSAKAPFDFSNFVLTHFSFIDELPEIGQDLPTTVTVDGKTLNLPADLGAEATLGQMWDVDLVIAAKQKDNQPVTLVSMAETLLPVFLWPLLKAEPYTDRHQAATLWPIISQMPVLDGLMVSGFFLRSSLNPTSSGKISSQPIVKTPLRQWPLSLRRVWQRLTSTSPAFS